MTPRIRRSPRESSRIVTIVRTRQPNSARIANPPASTDSRIQSRVANPVQSGGSGKMAVTGPVRQIIRGDPKWSKAGENNQHPRSCETPRFIDVTPDPNKNCGSRMLNKSNILSNRNLNHESRPLYIVSLSQVALRIPGVRSGRRRVDLCVPVVPGMLSNLATACSNDPLVALERSGLETISIRGDTAHRVWSNPRPRSRPTRRLSLFRPPAESQATRPMGLERGATPTRQLSIVSDRFANPVELLT
jgi:hypothetical protein